MRYTKEEVKRYYEDIRMKDSRGKMSNLGDIFNAKPIELSKEHGEIKWKREVFH